MNKKELAKANQNDTIRIGKKTFIFSAVVLLMLMIIAGTLSYVLPAGSYQRSSIDGIEVVVDGTYSEIDVAPLSPIRWLTAPFEVLGSQDGLTIIVIIIFLLFLGGAFTILNHSGALKYLVWILGKKFSKQRYLLLSLVSLFFMLLGTCAGIFEESVLLAPIAVALAIGLGFDVFTGLFISLLSTGFGFAAGVFNPFTTGVAQKLVGLPVFSGAPYRMFCFFVIYILLNVFLQIYAHKHVKKVDNIAEQKLDVDNVTNSKRSSIVFVLILLALFAWVALTSIVRSLADYTMPALAILFLIGGIIAGVVSKMGAKKILKSLLDGALGVAPGILLILMASSVKFIMSQSKVMDTLLYLAHNAMSGLGSTASSLSTYLLVLILNFFIGSGSAKAFLVMPIIAPLSTLSGVPLQTAVLSFLFGDGFSNVFYITNPVLLITLGITGVSYAKWFKKTWLLQLLTLITTAILVIIAI
jgi:uncharacterized ion transporter superfamily protein YfcC